MGNLFGNENISQNKINNLNNKRISKKKNDKKNNNSTKPYFRPKLKELSKEKEKKPLTPNELDILFKEKFSEIKFKKSNLKHLTQYYYNCESINDTNWGCAWRSLQTVLSYLLSIKKRKENISFKNLFLNYGKRDVLLNLYLKVYKKEEIPNYLNIPFSPFENENGWAEPFISKLILFDFGFEGQLILINNYPFNAYAPEEVFDKIIKFEDFVNLLDEHFNHENSTPVIIDDSIVSVIISGIKKENDFIYFIILDPHIRDDDKGEKGVYFIKLNKNGYFDFEENPQPTILGQTLCFDEKSWMVFIPNNI
jgi:hypothetical protein